ncbi:MAG: leucine--tRNA ligase, partial [Coriobacteriia bacterium]|nr:leucine--tRNA ligase [Coriobacteriia bacterium]
VLGNQGSVHQQEWPHYDDELARPDEIEYAVQINGRIRAKFSIALDASEDEVRQIALTAVKPYLEAAEPKQVVVVPGRLVNIVI